MLPCRRSATLPPDGGHCGFEASTAAGPGWAGLSPNPVEVGYVVHPTYWNRGIATEATLLAVADCFGRVGLDRLVALTTIDNKPSLRAMEKVGMQRRGETQHEDDPTTYELFEITPPPQGGSPG